MRHILSVEQFDHGQLMDYFVAADEFREQVARPDTRRELAARYFGHQTYNLFYEPSTRTLGSFEKAALNFGMGYSSVQNAHQFSSAAKGETLEDTIRVIDEYGYDAIILRHDEAGGAAKAAAVSHTPIVNAGDGKGEHPTQAILDAYTIYQKYGRLNNLNVVMGGDPKHGRTIRSLTKLLGRYPGNQLTFVSIPELQISDDIKLRLDEHGTRYSETAEMYDALRDADVVYWTRLQKERLEKSSSAIPDGGFVLGSVALEVIPERAIIMHPLPRVGEIEVEVDKDPRALYFRQAGNGVYIRMALLDKILQNA